MNKSKNPLIFISALLVAGLFLSGCGKDKAASPANDSGGSAASTENLTPERTITVTANDQMKFNVSEISVKAGEVIAIELKNIGTMPKFSMGHNLIVLAMGTDKKSFVETAMNAATTDYIPPSMESSIIAATKLLGGGESDTIVFRVPSKKGAYPFVCSFPGHFQVGMDGVMNVR